MWLDRTHVRITWNSFTKTTCRTKNDNLAFTSTTSQPSDSRASVLSRIVRQKCNRSWTWAPPILICKYMNWKSPAGYQNVSRCHSIGEPKDFIAHRQWSMKAGDPLWLWNPEQTYGVPQKVMMSSNFFKNKNAGGIHPQSTPPVHTHNPGACWDTHIPCRDTCWDTHLPSSCLDTPVDRQMLVKTLPSRNFVCNVVKEGNFIVTSVCPHQWEAPHVW